MAVTRLRLAVLLTLLGNKGLFSSYPSMWIWPLQAASYFCVPFFFVGAKLWFKFSLSADVFVYIEKRFATDILFYLSTFSHALAMTVCQYLLVQIVWSVFFFFHVCYPRITTLPQETNLTQDCDIYFYKTFLPLIYLILWLYHVFHKYIYTVCSPRIIEGKNRRLDISYSCIQINLNFQFLFVFTWTTLIYISKPVPPSFHLLCFSIACCVVLCVRSSSRK